MLTHGSWEPGQHSGRARNGEARRQEEMVEREETPERGTGGAPVRGGSFGAAPQS